MVFHERRPNDLPMRNIRPISVLFDTLDVSTIIYCWKALLLDRKLVLISSQNSLLFYVAEALRELLFPLRWPHSYVLPVPEQLKEVLGSPLLYLCGLNTSVASLEYIRDHFPEAIVCDLDSSFVTRDIDPLPELPKEHALMRIIQMNKRPGY